DEIAALGELCRANDLLLHVDGARIANAVAASGRSLAAHTRDAGVDVISVGGTKNGMLFGEAVVFLDPALAARAHYARKQAGQLASKMRFIAVQFSALLADDLWLRCADHANRMAHRLWEQVHTLPGVEIPYAPVVNSVFAGMPVEAMRRLRDWSFFWPW